MLSQKYQQLQQEEQYRLQILQLQQMQSQLASNHQHLPALGNRGGDQLPPMPNGQAMMPTPKPASSQTPCTSMKTSSSSQKTPATSKESFKWTKAEILLCLQHIAILKPSLDTQMLSWPKKFESIHTSVLKEDPSFRQTLNCSYPNNERKAVQAFQICSVILIIQLKECETLRRMCSKGVITLIPLRAFDCAGGILSP